jgi:glucose/arabinose dehydrogenase
MRLRKAYWLPLVVLLLILNACTTQTLQPTNSDPSLAAPATHTAAPEAPAAALQEPTPTLAQEIPTAITSMDTPPAAVTNTPSEMPESAAGFPDLGAYQWVTIAGGVAQPIYVNGSGDGSGRLFIASQGGRIYLVQDGQLLPEPFLDISDRSSPMGGGYSERGLLGVAFHPQFAQNGYFYVNFTDGSGNTHISRFQVSPDDPNRADPASELRLLFVEQPYPNHNGGGLTFGPDGYLYIALGDGGSAGDPQGNGQSLQTLLGKVLRIDVDGGQPYAIPADNPFASGGGLAEIWAYGLRNPWRIAFDGLTGDLYIADVGQNQYEEVNVQPAGSPGGMNYGWDFREGQHSYEGAPPESLALVDPMTEYTHAQGCSITGGVVYRGQALPEWNGVYLYGDYCSGLIWGLLPAPDGGWQNMLLFESGFTISSFGVDDAGEVYVTNYGSGEVFRLEKK